MMKDIPAGLDQVYKKYYADLNKEIQKVNDAKSGKDYALSAFNGGSREYFQSEADIKNHYQEIATEARNRGFEVLNKLLEEMKEKIDCGLMINTAKAAEIQAALPLIHDENALYRFASTVERRDDYSVIRSVAEHQGKNGQQNYAAVNIKNSLDNYENALSSLVRNTEKHVTDALYGKENSYIGWDSCIQSAIDKTQVYYDELQLAIKGEEQQTEDPFRNALDLYAQKIREDL